MVDRAQLLGAEVGHLDLDVALISGEGGVQACLLFLGETLLAGAQQVADPIQRVACAAAMTVDGLLDATPDIVDGSGAEFHNVERIMPTSA